MHTEHRVEITDELSNSNLPTNSTLVEFDIVKMYPSIYNEFGLKAVNDIIELRANRSPPTSCVLEAFELCLSCNNSIFDNKSYL